MNKIQSAKKKREETKKDTLLKIGFWSGRGEKNEVCAMGVNETKKNKQTEILQRRRKKKTISKHCHQPMREMQPPLPSAEASVEGKDRFGVAGMTAKTER